MPRIVEDPLGIAEGRVTLYEGDCLDVLRELPTASLDAVVTDPPYGLEFMGKGWDGVVPGVEFWRGVLRVVKPGGYLLAFGGTRTYHRLACAVEDAGFEVRDCLIWLYGTGFPKGRGCLKPAWEPILLARRPGPRVLQLGIDECRVPAPPWSRQDRANGRGFKDGKIMGGAGGGKTTDTDRLRESAAGRYPANVVHDGSDEVLEAFAAFGEKTSGVAVRRNGGGGKPGGDGRTTGRFAGGAGEDISYGDAGTAARFFYCAKASRKERGDGNTHPTVKPMALMRWLVRLVVPPGGTVLDPFAGSGTTGLTAVSEGRKAVLVEKSPEYCTIIKTRITPAAE